MTQLLAQAGARQVRPAAGKPGGAAVAGQKVRLAAPQQQPGIVLQQKGQYKGI